MDSGNSGSLQSSSGGDDEYDSRADSISALLNPPLTNHPPPPPPPSHRHHNSLFDPPQPLSNSYYDLLPRSSPPPLTNPTSYLNQDAVWAKTFRSDPNSTSMTPAGNDGEAAVPSPSSQLFSQPPRYPYPPPPPHENAARGSAPAEQGNPAAARNPKKRSRASRRAPTTVLTTDTTNFRALVQEFTGIPAPPFAASPFPRSRFDLFGASSALRSAAPPPSFLLRPFAQKAPQPQPTAAMLPASFSSSNPHSNGSNHPGSLLGNTTPFTFDHQQQNLHLLNMQNPILSFQSLLQNTSPDVLGKGHGAGNLQGNPEGADSTHLKARGLDHYGHARVNDNGTQISDLVPNINMVASSDGTAPLGVGDSSVINASSGGVWANGHQHPRDCTVNGGAYGNLFQRMSSGKGSFPLAGSQDFTGHKVATPAAAAADNHSSARTEGMLESWICSSD